MKIFRTVMTVMVAVFAFGAMTAANAMAAHQWLNSGGSALTKAEATLIDGTVILHFKVPAILGGGEILLLCTGQFHGTVGAGSSDEITGLLGLSGETSKVDCTVPHSTSALCGEGTLFRLTPLHLPWATSIELSGATVFDKMFKTGSGDQPAYETLCEDIEIRCEGDDRSTFTGNGTNGAKLEFRGETILMCTNGTATLLGSSEVLGGFVIS